MNVSIFWLGLALAVLPWLPILHDNNIKREPGSPRVFLAKACAMVLFFCSVMGVVILAWLMLKGASLI